MPCAPYVSACLMHVVSTFYGEFFLDYSWFDSCILYVDAQHTHLDTPAIRREALSILSALITLPSTVRYLRDAVALKYLPDCLLLDVTMLVGLLGICSRRFCVSLKTTAAPMFCSHGISKRLKKSSKILSELCIGVYLFMCENYTCCPIIMSFSGTSQLFARLVS